MFCFRTVYVDVKILKESLFINFVHISILISCRFFVSDSFVSLFSTQQRILHQLLQRPVFLSLPALAYYCCYVQLSFSISSFFFTPFLPLLSSPNSASSPAGGTSVFAKISKEIAKFSAVSLFNLLYFLFHCFCAPSALI